MLFILEIAGRFLRPLSNRRSTKVLLETIPGLCSYPHVFPQWHATGMLSCSQTSDKVGIGLLLYLVIALVPWPGTSMPDVVTDMIILLLDLAVVIDLVVERIRFVRWRREYELSVDRLIRTIHPGCEGGSAIEW
jgi:hypothetical protein